MAMASLVSISSPSILEIRTTISSTSHSSYFRGNTLGGVCDGLDRLGVFGRLRVAAAAAEGPPMTSPTGATSSSELRLLAGDSAVVAGREPSGRTGDILGSGGAVGITDEGTEGWLGCVTGVAVAAAVVVAVVEVEGCDASGRTPCRSTAGLKGSMGEYWVAASTPTYCFGRDEPPSDGDGECRMVCLDCRRGKAAVTRGD